jgi:hypothetical protein
MLLLGCGGSGPYYGMGWERYDILVCDTLKMPLAESGGSLSFEIEWELTGLKVMRKIVGELTGGDYGSQVR